MSIASKYNKEHARKFNFEIPENFGYESLANLYEKNGEDKFYTVRAIYINTKSRFGESPVVVIDDCMVNFPQHLTGVAKEMMTDDETVDAINNGKLGFVIYRYKAKHKKDNYYSVNWTDID